MILGRCQKAALEREVGPWGDVLRDRPLFPARECVVFVHVAAEVVAHGVLHERPDRVAQLFHQLQQLAPGGGLLKALALARHAPLLALDGPVEYPRQLLRQLVGQRHVFLAVEAVRHLEHDHAPRQGVGVFRQLQGLVRVDHDPGRQVAAPGLFVLAVDCDCVATNNAKQLAHHGATIALRCPGIGVGREQFADPWLEPERVAQLLQLGRDCVVLAEQGHQHLVDRALARAARADDVEELLLAGVAAQDVPEHLLQTAHALGVLAPDVTQERQPRRAGRRWVVSEGQTVEREEPQAVGDQHVLLGVEYAVLQRDQLARFGAVLAVPVQPHRRARVGPVGQVRDRLHGVQHARHGGGPRVERHEVHLLVVFLALVQERVQLCAHSRLFDVFVVRALEAKHVAAVGHQGGALFVRVGARQELTRVVQRAPGEGLLAVGDQLRLLGLVDLEDQRAQGRAGVPAEGVPLALTLARDVAVAGAVRVRPAVPEVHRLVVALELVVQGHARRQPVGVAAVGVQVREQLGLDPGKVPAVHGRAVVREVIARAVHLALGDQVLQVLLLVGDGPAQGVAGHCEVATLGVYLQPLVVVDVRGV